MDEDTAPSASSEEMGDQDRQGIYIDLCDKRRRVVRVDENGWRLANPEELPVFARWRGMKPLPNPEGVEGDLDALRPFVNVRSEDDWRLVLAYLLAVMRPTGPYPVLVVTGAAGSSKSTFCRALRSVVDPAIPPTQAMPRKEQDLVITATRSHLLVIDNVREIPNGMSDAFCRLATGGGCGLASTSPPETRSCSTSCVPVS